MRVTEVVAQALARIEACDLSGIWIDRLPAERVLRAARAVEGRLATGEAQPLAGRTVAVKGNIDVAGLRTTAGCPSFGDVAATSAPAVRALEAAGAVVVGSTNLDQFATGLVGTRSPHGACPNPRWPHLVSGGSSSGSAAAVAAGLVDLGVGTDTAGSGRVPAAANGIVGLKPTRGRLSTRGVVPACASLDCISVFAGSVGLAAGAVAAAAGFDADDPWSRRPGAVMAQAGPLRIGVPDPDSLRLHGEVTADLVGAAWTALAEAAGATLVEVDLDAFTSAGRLLYGGAFVAERYAAVGGFLESGPRDADPVVRAIILASASAKAWELAADRTELERLRRRTEATWAAVDVLAVPTVPGLPSRDEVAADPVGANAELGHYTSCANLLDLCALTLPVGPDLDGHPPVSLTLVGPAWHDDLLVAIAGTVDGPPRGGRQGAATEVPPRGNPPETARA